MRRLICNIRQTIATSLQWKLTLSYMGVIILSLIVMQCCLMIVLGYFLYRRNVHTSFHVGELARDIASALKSDFSAPQPDIEHIETKLQRFQLIEPPIPPDQIIINLQFVENKVFVVNATQQVIASSNPDGYPKGIQLSENKKWAPLIGNALGGETDIQIIGKLILADKEIQSFIGTYPILGFDGSVYGAVCVMVPFFDKNRLVGMAVLFGATTALVFMACLLATIIAGFFGYRSARSLILPIKQLSQATQSISNGDFKRQIEEYTNDEIGQLTKHFNRMATQLGQTMSELDNEKRQVESLLMAKQALVANVSHELRTPITTIRAHAESLLAGKENLSVEVREYLQIIQNEIDILNNLIDDFFYLSRLEGRELELNIAPLDIGVLIQRTVRIMKKIAWEKHKISLNQNIPDPLPDVLADGQRVRQIITNLIQNALRFTPEGGLVMIRAQAQSEIITVTIQDTGMGIAPEDLPNIFERFYRADKSRNRAHGGRGLGLSIVKQLVAMHKGEIGVTSEPGKGSVFWFTLPIVS